MRLQHRKDTSHDDYVARLERGGWLVIDTHNVSDFVDAIGIRSPRVVFFEFKSTAKDYGKDKARAQKQADLHTRLRRAGAEVFVVRSQDDLAQVEGSEGA
jgi:hypothetical protein